MFRTLVVVGSPAVGKSSFTAQFGCQLGIHDIVFEDFKQLYPESTRYARCVEGIKNLVGEGMFKYIFLPSYAELREELVKQEVKYVTVSHAPENVDAV